MAPNAYHAPVATYNLDVVVSNPTADQEQVYRGAGTLHLTTGLVVLPNMPNPEAPVLPFAVAWVAQEGRDIFSAAMAQTSPPAPQAPLAVAQPVPAQPIAAVPRQPSFDMPDPVPPVSSAGPASLNDPLLPNGQVVLPTGQVVAQPVTQVAQPGGQDGGVAYGVDDPALRPRPKHDHQKVSPYAFHTLTCPLTSSVKFDRSWLVGTDIDGGLH